MMLQIISTTKSFQGQVVKYQHYSNLLECDMKFNVYFPPSYEKRKRNPSVFFLSGLTCNEDNFITKSGAIQKASALGLVLICPDTSPRGLNIPGEDESWDFGTGAGFYLDATQEPFKRYQMYSYITQELYDLCLNEFKLNVDAISIFGHSMGGHGSLICALKNPGKYKCVSAFAPICNPSQVPWGIKAFEGYLGKDQSLWKNYDASMLIKDYRGPYLRILIDTGTNDSFLETQLKIHELKETLHCTVNNRLQEGYDHSYYFISTFINEHLEFHAAALYMI